MKKSIIIAITLFQAIACFSQRNSYFFFYLVNSGRKPMPGHTAIKDLVISTPLYSVVSYNHDTISGKLTIKKGILSLEAPDGVRTLSFEDSGIHSIRLFQDGVELFLKKVNVPGQQKLRRVLLDTLGFTVYDDVFSFSSSVHDVDYDELIFEYDRTIYPVTDFWTTSRKRKMIDILNRIFKSDLKYSEYQGKELLLESILNFSNRALQKPL
jgi:hypothetical protein